jgi:DNA-binding CsgD family transcriptional regulator
VLSPRRKQQSEEQSQPSELTVADLVEGIESGSLRPRISPIGDGERLKGAITQLDDRARQILTWMAEGESDDEIVLKLWIPVKTLRRERRGLIRQLHGEEERGGRLRG